MKPGIRGPEFYRDAELPEAMLNFLRRYAIDLREIQILVGEAPGFKELERAA